MAPTPSIYVRKNTPYKGGTKEWGNRYHFTGGSPSTLAHWQALADAVVADEATCLSDTAHIDEVRCYDAGSDVPVHTFTYSTAGVQTSGSGLASSPLETSALIRYGTDQRTSKNHPIYLFTYIRGVYRQIDIGRENLGTAQKAAVEEYADDWLAGFSDGDVTHVRCGPNGAVALNRLVGTYVTHRDFPT
jgi:hypothetical protein